MILLQAWEEIFFNVFFFLKKTDDAFNRGLEEGRSTIKTISQASYERGLNEGKQQQNSSGKTTTTPDKSQINENVKIMMKFVFPNFVRLFLLCLTCLFVLVIKSCFFFV